MPTNSEMSVTQLKEYYDLMVNHYTKDHRRMRLLDSTDRGDLWKALGAKFPSYQILPDTNHVAYVKNNILASIYTVMKSADIQPTSEKDMEITTHLNIAMSRIWDLSQVGYFQFQAGERAALLNLGLTQVGWSEELTGGNGDTFFKGGVTLKNLNPIRFMRDPFAVDLESAGYCCYAEDYHRSVFLENPNYREKFLAYAAKKDSATTPVPELNERPSKSAAKGYYTLVIFWVKEDKKINEYHVLNLEEILHKQEDIQPSCFPIADLYCNLPVDSPVGASEPAKVFANNVAYNLMDSIALTAEYKNQRPPKFINASSGLNIQSFAKHGDEADRTFIVNGMADKAVYYHQFPQTSPYMSTMKIGLQKDIQLTSGVDGRYTGRDTGSIITTGGTEEMLNRVTLIDTPKILNYERYTKKLTNLILANMINHSQKRKYFFKRPDSTRWETTEVDFPKIDNDTLFSYAINIGSELPTNKQRVASMANMLMEKQMQYQQEGSAIQLITEEEWLMFQDLPNKEFMLERMGIQRLTDATEEVSQVLFEYADLVKNGMRPDDAIMAVAQSLKDKRGGMIPEGGPIPAVAQAGQGMAPPMGPMGGPPGIMPQAMAPGPTI